MELEAQSAAIFANSRGVQVGLQSHWQTLERKVGDVTTTSKKSVGDIGVVQLLSFQMNALVCVCTCSFICLRACAKPKTSAQTGCARINRTLEIGGLVLFTKEPVWTVWPPKAKQKP